MSVTPEEFRKVMGHFATGVTIVTTANTDEEGRALLKMLGMPFRP